MTSKTCSSWNDLLAQKEGLSLRMLAILNEESSALFANDISLIKEACEKKSAILKEFADFQLKLDEVRKLALTELNLEQDASVRKIFDQLEQHEAIPLQHKREHLERLSRKIIKVNQFNEECLSTYLDQVRLTQNVIVSFMCPDPTYNARGRRRQEQRGGGVLNRSF